MKKRDPIAELCQDWVQWRRTRGMYVKQSGGSMLGRMQPSKSGREPNARNHADMMYFNMAIHTALDMPDWARRGRAFMVYYTTDVTSVKRAADELAISRPTFYEHVKAFADYAFRLSQGIKKAHEENFCQPEPPQPAASTSPDAIDATLVRYTVR